MARVPRLARAGHVLGGGHYSSRLAPPPPPRLQRLDLQSEGRGNQVTGQPVAQQEGGRCPGATFPDQFLGRRAVLTDTRELVAQL